MVEVLRYASFTMDGAGGNPAGVVPDASELEPADMQRIAAEVGYSETAFLTPRHDEPNVFDVRYFSPRAEVPFCGHATIASAVALVERKPADELIFHTPVGFVSINTRTTKRGLVAELTSVAPRVEDAPAELIDGALTALRWSLTDLDPDYPIKIGYAGASHLILVARTRQRLSQLVYDFDALAAVMERYELITCQLIWPESRKLYYSRNPFPPGGVVEDPATGAAAAAFGGYLRELGKIGTTARFRIVQGVDLGRPSRLDVEVMAGEPGVRVSGTASLIRD